MGLITDLAHNLYFYFIISLFLTLKRTRKASGTDTSAKSDSSFEEVKETKKSTRRPKKVTEDVAVEPEPVKKTGRRKKVPQEIPEPVAEAIEPTLSESEPEKEPVKPRKTGRRKKAVEADAEAEILRGEKNAYVDDAF